MRPVFERRNLHVHAHQRERWKPRWGFRLTGMNPLLLLRREGWPNGKAPVLKTGGRKPLGVRVPRPPLMKGVLIWSPLALAACAGAIGAGERPEPCPGDSRLYSYADTALGVVPPVFLRTTNPPRQGFSRTTAQGIVSPTGRVESGSVRGFGGGPEERLAAGDALFWSRFSPATLNGCAVRFLYRVTYMAGIRQRVPDDVADTTGGNRR